MNRMRTDQGETAFARMPNGRVLRLKYGLRRADEHLHPGRSNLIRVVLDEEDATAWGPSSFPVLFFSDAMNVRVARLGSQPRAARHNEKPRPSGLSRIENNQLFLYVDR